MEDVRKGMERAGKREIRAFCDEECAREAQDRPRKAQAAGAERQSKEFQRQACTAVIDEAVLDGHFPIGSFPRSFFGRILSSGELGISCICGEAGIPGQESFFQILGDLGVLLDEIF